MKKKKDGNDVNAKVDSPQPLSCDTSYEIDAVMPYADSHQFTEEAEPESPSPLLAQ